jgi:hypothetical protein
VRQETRSNGARPRVNRDPDRRPTRPAAGWWPLPEGLELTVCGGCSALVPATDTAQRRHRAFHEAVDAGLPR